MTSHLRSPHALASAFLRREGYAQQAKGQELDDVYADALHAIAEALHTWRADGGRSLASWCWQTMGRDVPRAQARRHRWRMECAVDRLDPWEVGDDDPVWLRGTCVEDGYAAVDARDELERICRWAALTPAEAEATGWFAVHGGTLVRHLGGHEAWWPGRDHRAGTWHASKRKLRAAAAACDEWFEHRQAEAA